MKNRISFVTNSSSSSFIIRNNTDDYMSSEDVARSLIAKIIEDAKDKFSDIPPHSQIIVECGDGGDDGSFENFIHNEVDKWWHHGDGKATVEFYESHH